MAIPALDSFSALGEFQNFERDAFETLEDMKNFNEDFLPEQFVAICYEDASMYYFNKKNTIDEITGKWRKFSGGSGDSEVKISMFEIGGMEGIHKYGEEIIIGEMLVEVIDGSNDKVSSITITDGLELNETYNKAGSYTIELNKNYGEIKIVDGEEIYPEDVLFTITVETEKGRKITQYKKIIFDEYFNMISDEEIKNMF